MRSLPGQAAEKALRVAVLNHSPPMSYTDEAGVLTGFNVEIMYALCEAMGVKCEPVPVTLERVVDVVAAGEFDFAAVSLLSTPERRARVLMSKPYYRSISVWFARPGIVPGAVSAAVVRGGVQARYVQAQGWRSMQLENHGEVVTALLRGTVEAALLPMATAVAVQQDARIHPLGLATTLLRDQQLAGDVCLSVNPRAPELLARLNGAIDQIKRDGRFDRINSRFCQATPGIDPLATSGTDPLRGLMTG
jgi:polar amino acid transport system substrate-binding protein